MNWIWFGFLSYCLLGIAHVYFRDLKIFNILTDVASDVDIDNKKDFQRAVNKRLQEARIPPIRKSYIRGILFPVTFPLMLLIVGFKSVKN